ncbi:hypothetical protein HRI_004084700 [Hibiscus trionum]|uniref:Endonuclease/exonuclease/phosphatase domain-containing protein n=1 Tax=Hibiscus trionum TaxID=183268 RepID=A0A9W7IYA6_HIBTR|nr:hypothetical protein HRI_004084700 [Hibiscus trionum]
MTILAWNVMGMGNKKTVLALKNSIFKFNSSIIFLGETKQKEKYMERLRMRMNFYNSFYFDPIGIAGGLDLCWKKEVVVSILQAEKNFINSEISVNEEEAWYNTFIYGPSYYDEKEKFWQSLSSLRGRNQKRWCIIGDSNIVARKDEKARGSLSI